MVTRKSANDTPPLNAEEAAPLLPSPGSRVRAKTTLDYEIDGSNNAHLFGCEQGISDEDIEALAAEDIQLDPLTRFCQEWANYVGYNLVIVRLPDPAARRMPGNQFRNPCFEVENLGEIPFDPSSLVATLQIVNGNSGGAFRLFLRDHNGQLIPDARLDRIVISDPARGYNPTPVNTTPGVPAYPSLQNPPAKPPEKSAMELRMESLQAQLFETALTRALNPPIPPPGSGLSDEDRLAVLLLSKGDLLGNVINKITAIAQAPDAASATPGWRERLIDASIDIATKNPVLIERVSSTIERIVQTILPPRQGQIINEPVSYAPEAQPNYAPAMNPAPETNLKLETLKPETNNDPENDDDMADIVECIITRLGDSTPLDMRDPLFTELANEYPLKFRFICGLIAQSDLDDIIAYISDKSELYAMLLTSPATGAHYRARVQELQNLLRQAKQSAEAKINAARQQQTEAPANAPES